MNEIVAIITAAVPVVGGLAWILILAYKLMDKVTTIRTEVLEYRNEVAAIRAQYTTLAMDVRRMQDYLERMKTPPEGKDGKLLQRREDY